MNRRLILLAGAAALAAPATAQAHVTVQPATAPSGGFTVESVRVPSEKDNANTTKVDVLLPPGFLDVSYQPIPGWKVELTTRKLAKPVKVEDDLVSEEVEKATFTATGKGLAPGQYQDFPLSVAMPKGAPGTKLTFKAVQTYSDGSVVRWIGPAGSDSPAPQVTLTAASADENASAPAAAPAGTVITKTKTDNGLAIVALIVGALGLLAGAAGLAAARRATSRA
jgi:uncharacterized protein